MAVPLVHYVFLPVSGSVSVGVCVCMCMCVCVCVCVYVCNLYELSSHIVGPDIEAHFTPVPVYDDSSTTHTLLVTHRHQHFSVLHIRSAQVVDNDDLMPLFQQLPDSLDSQYGGWLPVVVGK